MIENMDIDGHEIFKHSGSGRLKPVIKFKRRCTINGSRTRDKMMGEIRKAEKSERKNRCDRV